MSRIVSIFSFFVFVILSVFGNSYDIPSNPIDKRGYTLIFGEEFDNDELDSSKWLDEYLPHASDSVDGCKARYQINNGVLDLMLTEDMPQYACYTTMKVSSIQTIEKNNLHPGGRQMREVEPFNGFAIKYGYFEMRAKLPDCKGGGHIAWWLIGTQDEENHDGEIDILENLFDSNNVFSPKIWHWHDSNISDFRKDVKLPGKFDKSYHIYAMDWTPKGLTFYVDGIRIAHTKSSPDYEMGMLLGIYTGCDWDGTDNMIYPKTFSIDYIRVYQKNSGY